MSVVTKASQFSSTETCTLSLQARTLVGVGYSLTITSKQHVPVLPWMSSTTKQLVVVPIGNSEPDGRPEVCVMMPALLTTPYFT